MIEIFCVEIAGETNVQELTVQQRTFQEIAVVECIFLGSTSKPEFRRYVGVPPRSL